jgi:hypothetical protein
MPSSFILFFFIIIKKETSQAAWGMSAPSHHHLDSDSNLADAMMIQSNHPDIPALHLCVSATDQIRKEAQQPNKIRKGGHHHGQKKNTRISSMQPQILDYVFLK